MSTNYMIFMGVMTASLLAMLSAWGRTIHFFRRYKQPEQEMLNPLHAIVLWRRFFTAGAFGEEAEPARRAITRTYLLALGLFAFAIFLFYWLPAVPRAG